MEVGIRELRNNTAEVIAAVQAGAYSVSEGVLPSDRRHVLNVSWNAFLPDGAKGGLSNVFGRGLLNGWQLSGISSWASGIPYRLSFSGEAASRHRSAGKRRSGRMKHRP